LEIEKNDFENKQVDGLELSENYGQNVIEQKAQLNQQLDELESNIKQIKDKIAQGNKQVGEINNSLKQLTQKQEEAFSILQLQENEAQKTDKESKKIKEIEEIMATYNNSISEIQYFMKIKTMQWPELLQRVTTSLDILIDGKKAVTMNK